MTPIAITFQIESTKSSPIPKPAVLHGHSYPTGVIPKSWKFTKKRLEKIAKKTKQTKMYAYDA